MKSSITLFAALFASALLPAASLSQADGDLLFQQGKFADAEKAYSQVLAADPKNAAAEQRLGEIALFSNHFAQAEEHLRQAISLSPDSKKAKSLLAQTFFRQDDFQQAAKWFRAAGDESQAEALESFKDVKAYRIAGNQPLTVLKFVATDPLPTVLVKVNGGEAEQFMIDTGGPEIVIESEYAKKIGLTSLSGSEGTFAGGKKAGVRHSRASFTLGDFLIQDVPAVIVPLPQVQGTKIRGIIGTELLYHFLATLDYPGGQLILRRKTADALKPFDQPASATRRIVMPFWMAGDHYMVAWGRVNQRPPVLLFVDTGLSMGGFVCPDSTLKEASIKPQPPDEKKADDSAGTANPASASQASANQASANQASAPAAPTDYLPFVVDHLSLGDAEAEKIDGLTGVFPPTLENSFGFRIAGLISQQFFQPYAVTFDFTGMRIFLEKK